VPTISEFHGITIRMFHSDHAPPHLDATYGEFEATIGIAPVDVISGHLPAPARRLALEWARIHRRDLAANWQRAMQLQPLRRIAPLP
jgi:hypothetical protein